LNFKSVIANQSLPAFDTLFKGGSVALWRKLTIEAKKESNMASANSKDKDEQTRAAIESYPIKSAELISSNQIRVRKGQHLDVDRVLARSFKDVKSISSALNQQSFGQGKAT
jgi:hypothetical protein